MRELPDIVVYIEHLERRITGSSLKKNRIASAFLVRSFDPPIGAAEGLGLRLLPDRGPASRRPVALPSAARRLAAIPGGTRVRLGRAAPGGAAPNPEGSGALEHKLRKFNS